MPVHARHTLRIRRRRLEQGRRVSVGIQRAMPLIHIPVPQLRGLIQRVLRAEQSVGHVEVIIGGDRLLRRLNARFRRKDQATDVLSFPLSAGLIGEVYCNYDHCRRWQKEHGGTLASELSRLAVHGCLHLLGYDHHTAKEQRRMQEAENRYLSTPGLINTRRAGRLSA